MSAFSEKQKIIACFTDWYPFSYLNNGQPAGLSIELYRAVIKRANLDIIYKQRPWKRCRLEVVTGKMDAAVDGDIRIDNNLNAKKRPIPWASVFWVKQSSLYRNFEDYSQFEGKHIVYVRGYGYPREFLAYQGFRRSAVTTDLQGLKVLQYRKVDAFAGDFVSSTRLAKLHDLKVRPIIPAFQLETLTLSFHKTLKEEHARFEVALNEMYEDGSIDVFYRKYLGTTYHEFMKTHFSQ